MCASEWSTCIYDGNENITEAQNSLSVIITNHIPVNVWNILVMPTGFQNFTFIKKLL